MAFSKAKSSYCRFLSSILMCIYNISRNEVLEVRSGVWV